MCWVDSALVTFVILLWDGFGFGYFSMRDLQAPRPHHVPVGTFLTTRLCGGACFPRTFWLDPLSLLAATGGFFVDAVWEGS